MSAVTTFKPGDLVHVADDKLCAEGDVHLYKIVHVLRQTETKAEWVTIRDLTATGNTLQTVQISRLTHAD